MCRRTERAVSPAAEPIRLLIGVVGAYFWPIALTVAAFGLTYWAVSHALEE